MFIPLICFGNCPTTRGNILLLPCKSLNFHEYEYGIVELDHSDSGREGCTVTTLTITADPKNWQNAIRVVVHELG
ncbi:hypothetical protein P8452_67014 [Trifolium repens]|nr:hypothetical protein P8452_67014 [Trifolium repens]